MKKLLAMLALSLAMVACGEKQDAATQNADQPVQAIEETIEEQVTPATPEEIKAAEEAAGKDPVEAVEETVEEQVQEVPAPTTEKTQ